MYAVLSKKAILTTPWLNLFQEQVEYPNGERAPYYTVTRGDGIVVLAQVPDGRIVLIREYKHGIGTYTWQLPAGHPVDVLHDRETSEEAARRELLEETGYGGGTLQPFVFVIPSAPHWSDDLIYLCRITDVERRQDSHLEASELVDKIRLVTPALAIDMIWHRGIRDPFSVLNILIHKEQL